MKNKHEQSKLLIVTTPMCQEILLLLGISDFKITKNQDYTNADFAVVLSETKNLKNSNTIFIKLKLNTFSQIEQSINKIAKVLNTETRSSKLNEQLKYSYLNDSYFQSKTNENQKIKVKVYSNFLKDIVEDMGYLIITDDNYDYLVYPDYLKNEIKEINFAVERAIELPSHKNAPLNPIKRAKLRYKILEKNLCMKH
jgi:hypothetical protein